MSLPPSLLYLVVYNPTLQPPSHTDDGDEDAEERAHVLFYTAKEWAVSKDKMLRQVGVAKALVNFSSFFNGPTTSEAVYSQTSRLITISPEPDYWIHACVELGKDARPVRQQADKTKGKASKSQTSVLYDYRDGSVHDAALRTQLLQGYEAFKISHGSFASILQLRGKETLELQLERFFSVWAWSWDLEGQANFRNQFGIPVHPLSNEIAPLIQSFTNTLPMGTSPVVVCPPCVIASKSFPMRHAPLVLSHLLSLPQVRTPSIQSKATKSDLHENKRWAQSSTMKAKTNGSRTGTSTFLGIPSAISMSKMDVRNWTWPDALTFGGSTKSPKTDTLLQQPVPKAAPKETESNEVHVDPQLIQDSMDSSINSPVDEMQDPLESMVPVVVDNIAATAYPSEPHVSGPAVLEHAQAKQSRAPSDTPSPTSADIHHNPFLDTLIYLPSHDCMSSRRTKIRYLLHERLLLALIPPMDAEELSQEDLVEIGPGAIELLQNIKDAMDDSGRRITEALSTPSVQSVLQKSQAFIATPSQLTYGSTSFTSSSGHLHEACKILRSSSDIIEVFSRSQDPQDWFIAKRMEEPESSFTDPDTTSAQTGPGRSKVYMEIGRKEASLADVDNELSGVVRRFLDST